jgi:hypothetical protein
VVAGVVGEGHARVALDALELLAEAERGRERDCALIAIPQADGSHRGSDRAARTRLSEAQRKATHSRR